MKARFYISHCIVEPWFTNRRGHAGMSWHVDACSSVASSNFSRYQLRTRHAISSRPSLPASVPRSSLLSRLPAPSAACFLQASFDGS